MGGGCGCGGGGRKQASKPRCGLSGRVTRWLGRKVARSQSRRVAESQSHPSVCRDVQLSCSCRKGGDGRDGVVVCAWLPLREGNRPNGVGLGRPSQPDQSLGLDWAGLTRLETTGLLDGGMFPAQHMAENDKGAPTEQARPRRSVVRVWCLAGTLGIGPALASIVWPGSLAVWVWSRCRQSPWFLDPGSAHGLTRLHHLLPLYLYCSITSHCISKRPTA